MKNLFGEEVTDIPADWEEFTGVLHWQSAHAAGIDCGEGIITPPLPLSHIRIEEIGRTIKGGTPVKIHMPAWLAKDRALL